MTKPITPNEFNFHTVAAQLTPLIAGKTLERIATEDNGDYFLVFFFTDETKLSFRYDWIYS